jgi:hypothetical protein
MPKPMKISHPKSQFESIQLVRLTVIVNYDEQKNYYSGKDREEITKLTITYSPIIGNKLWLIFILRNLYMHYLILHA